MSGVKKTHDNKQERVPVHRSVVLSHFASVVSVAISTAGLLFATQREIHSRAATRACMAFFVSRAATTSSTTYEGIEVWL